MKLTAIFALALVALASAEKEYELKTYLWAKGAKTGFLQWVPYANTFVFGQLTFTAKSNGFDLGEIGGSNFLELMKGNKVYKVTLPDNLTTVDSIGLKWTNSDSKMAILFVSDLKVCDSDKECETFRSEHTALRPKVVYNFDRVIKPTEPTADEPTTESATEPTTEPVTEPTTNEPTTNEQTTDEAEDTTESSSETIAAEVTSEETTSESATTEAEKEVASEDNSAVEVTSSTDEQTDEQTDSTSEAANDDATTSDATTPDVPETTATTEAAVEEASESSSSAEVSSEVSSGVEEPAEASPLPA